MTATNYPHPIRVSTHFNQLLVDQPEKSKTQALHRILTEYQTLTESYNLLSEQAQMRVKEKEAMEKQVRALTQEGTDMQHRIDQIEKNRNTLDRQYQEILAQRNTLTQTVKNLQDEIKQKNAHDKVIRAKLQFKTALIAFFTGIITATTLGIYIYVLLTV